MSNERVRQITNTDDFPLPVDTGPRHSWNRGEVEAWMDEVLWWESMP